MTTTQISNFLSELGYSLDKEIAMKEVSSILLNIDQNLYPGKTTRFNFSTKHGELLLVYYGHEDSEGNFIKNQEVPNFFISFSTIVGFHMVSPNHISEPYKLSLAV